MPIKTIKIGNMCCDRCITTVKQILDQLGIKHKKVGLGFAEIHAVQTVSNSSLEDALRRSGFELIKTKEESISEKIKIAIHKIFFGSGTDDLRDFNLQKYMEEQIHIPYRKLSAIFSKHTKKTIEHYFITHRIEKAKVMIEETDYSFSEIAFLLGYSSLSHLSRQFKSVEKCSMHDYKRLKHRQNRKSIDKL